jgi:hypothetical protein
MAGIGLLMQQDGGPDSKVFIKSIVPGGAVDQDGSIQVGDGVLAVNGEQVVGLPVADIRSRIVGPIGSQVKVVFEGKSGNAYERTLTRMRGTQATDTTTTVIRQSMDSNQILSRSLDGRLVSQMMSASMPAPAFPLSSTNDAENSRLKSRVAELDSQLGIVKTELQRTKTLLDHDRTASMRSVKEIDNMQRKNAEQLMETQMNLNKSEQRCRNLELEVASSKAREEEFRLAFTRAKEQSEARELYFADLKKQFEEMRLGFEQEVTLLKEAKLESDRQRGIAEQNAERASKDLAQMKDKERDRREKEEGVRQLMHEAETKLIEAKSMEEKVRGQMHALHLLFGQWHKDFFINKAKEEVEVEQYFLA